MWSSVSFPHPEPLPLGYDIAWYGACQWRSVASVVADNPGF